MHDIVQDIRRKLRSIEKKLKHLETHDLDTRGAGASSNRQQPPGNSMKAQKERSSKLAARHDETRKFHRPTQDHYLLMDYALEVGVTREIIDYLVKNMPDSDKMYDKLDKIVKLFEKYENGKNIARLKATLKLPPYTIPAKLVDKVKFVEEELMFSQRGHGVLAGT